jgi:hypothetical protein
LPKSIPDHTLGWMRLGTSAFGAGRNDLRSAEKRIALALLLFLAAGLVLAQPCAAGNGVFENTGSLVSARTVHTATLLPNGKVLVAGGFDHAVLASAELYDPASGTWTATSSLAAGRGVHSATLLPSGKVLVVGGYDDPNYLASAELYDPASGSWTATGNLGVPRAGHTVTLLPNGKVLVAGGFNASGDLSSAELYDPASGDWTPTGSFDWPRVGHSATLLLNGDVLAAAGNEPFVGAHPFGTLYDPTNGTWTRTGNLGISRGHHTATLLPDSRVLVAGGSDYNPIASAECYDPASGTWTATASMATYRYRHTATLLADGTVLVVGGRGGSTASSNNALAAAEVYNPGSGAWSAAGNLTAARYDHTATFLPDGKVLVTGGRNDGGVALASAELYVGPPTPPTLLNISTRLRALTGDKVPIGGFIITGTELKRVLIRGTGPSLNGILGTLSDPTLELHRGSATLATNDNWKIRADGTSQQADIEATTIPPANDFEPAILTMLSPGAYTVILAGKNNGTGVGLVELYDLGQGATSQPANISTRGFVDTGDNVMIGGLIVGGGSGGAARVIVRAIGPSVPVAGALADPTLELRDASGTLVASNDNWKMHSDGSSQQAEIEATGLPPANDLESALLQTFPAGNYTAIVRGVNNTTGIGLVEAYHLP